MDEVQDELDGTGVENKRKTLRKRVNIPCALRIPGEILPGRLLDLSMGGAFIHTRKSVLAGTEFEVVFKVRLGKKPKYMKLRGTIVHSGRFLLDYENFNGIGVQFTPLSQADAADLSFLLNSLKPEPSAKKYQLTN